MTPNEDDYNPAITAHLPQLADQDVARATRDGRDAVVLVRNEDQRVAFFEGVVRLRASNRVARRVAVRECAPL